MYASSWGDRPLSGKQQEKKANGDKRGPICVEASLTNRPTGRDLRRTVSLRLAQDSF